MAINIEIKESNIEAWINKSMQDNINSLFREGYGAGGEIKKMVNEAIVSSQPRITAAIHASINDVCQSKEFSHAVQKEIMESLAKLYRGAFDSVLRAAAKNAASTEAISKRVIEVTKFMQETKE